MSESESKNINYVKKFAREIIEMINTCDVEKLKEMKGELRVLYSTTTPLEFAMGFIAAALIEYQMQTKIFVEEDTEDEEK